ncbi:MAG: DNA translocase FtsK 4TM domain-containing protein, partial [Clostridia bacterium]
MGRKKKVAKKTLKNDLFGGIIVVISLILFVFLLFDNIGNLSSVVKNILVGLFGVTSYVLPFILLFIGVYIIFKDEKIKFLNEALKGIFVLINLSTIVYLFSNVTFKMFDNILKYIVNTFNSGNLLGGFLSNVSVDLIGKIPSIILFIFIGIFSTLFLLNISIKQFSCGIYN